MTKENIKELLEYQGVYEIVYKKELENRIWHISCIERSKEFEDKCIYAFCHEIGKYLNFNIEKIVSAERYWIDILDDEDRAPKSGIYLFTCRGDNHLINELYHLEQGDKLYKFFEGEYHHMNGWFVVTPLAYHFVKEYNSDITNSGWEAVTREIKNIGRGYVRIVIAKTEAPEKFISYVAKGDKDLQYCLIDTFDFFAPRVPFIKPLSIYTAVSYTEMNHGIHWKLYEKAHPGETNKE